MKPYEIVKDIYIVGGPDITDGRDGCVYLMNLGELILIDTGAGWSVEKIIKNIEKFGFDCKSLKKIILTHCHIDHIGGVPEIKKTFDCKIYIHKLDAPPLETGDPILTAANWYQTNFPPTPVDVKLNLSEEILTIGEQKIVCLHTPGHTPGSICIYLDKDGKRILFGQDLHGPLLSEFGSNLVDYGRSTKRLLDLEADILCEGHFGIYKTKKDVRDYILSYRRQYGVE
ncbi:MAG TPA: MBL fold metallo-hydrolase [Thermodesulfobacteriota bacterium]|jgi:glyoxylase-like metal-dependent hydrolase (beta-lactamase superfamily II)|nr:MBL fold metallo-hydrolase [Thermodesulfobacteriota bacterium]